MKKTIIFPIVCIAFCLILGYWLSLQKQIPYGTGNEVPPQNINQLNQTITDNKSSTFTIESENINNEKVEQFLLPKQVGFKWNYTGFAEYAHNMELKSITHFDDRTEYLVKGTVVDASGLPPTENHKFTILYTATDTSLRETILRNGRLPNKIYDFDLIRTPMVKGNKWNEKVTLQGKSVDIYAQIIDAGTDDKGRFYATVKYQTPFKGMPNDTYSETRTIKQGLGVVYFENTFDKDITFNYHYNEPQEK